MHLYTLVYMFMHESCLLVCRPCFNIMKSWTFDPNLHLSLVDTTFCVFSCLFSFCLFACYLACSPSRLFACILVSLLAVYIMLIRFVPFHMLFASFLSIACLLVSCLCLCVYAHRLRTLGVKARSPRHKRKGRGYKHLDVSRVAKVNRFRSLAFPFVYVLF